MNTRPAEAAREAIFDEIFAAAVRDQRVISADELMRAIGLKRTSINHTYADVNERRKAHNATVRRSNPSGRAAQESSEITHLKARNAALRRELKLEKGRSEAYARVIRRQALQLYALTFRDRAVTDARGRFGREGSDD